MMRNTQRILFAVLLAATTQSTSVVVHGISVETEAPVGESVCLVCDSNANCSSYANYSICLQGQCTSDRGLFGLGCKCSGNEECASARCDGVFRKTCVARKPPGALCNQNSDCTSELCNSLFLCANIQEVSEVLPTANSTATTIGSTQNQNESSATTLMPTFSLEELASCITCSNETECGSGHYCVDNVCTHLAGVVPPMCELCVNHRDCMEGYYCSGDGRIGRTGRRCHAKKQSGEKCTQGDECRSDHCNFLFQCAGEIPGQVSDHKVRGDAFEDGETVGGMLIWGFIILAVLVFGVSSCVFCRRDGFQRTFGRLQYLRNPLPQQESNESGPIVQASETMKPELCDARLQSSCSGCPESATSSVSSSANNE